MTGIADMQAARDPDGPIVQSAQRVSRDQLLRLGSWFTLALCLVAAVLPLAFGQPGVWSALGPVGLFTARTVLGATLGLVAGAAAAVLIMHWRPLHVIAEDLARLVAWEHLSTWDYISVAFMAALGEELLFRGALQPLIGLVPTSVIFGLLHATSVAHVILAGSLGLLLGWLFHWSGSLWPPIAAHLVLDTVAGVLLARRLRWDTRSGRGD